MVEVNKGDWVVALVGGSSSIVGRVSLTPDEVAVLVDGGFVDYPESMARKGGQYIVHRKHIIKKLDHQPTGWIEDTPENRREYYTKKQAQENKNNG